MIKKILGFGVALALLYGAAWLGAAFWLRAELQGFASDLRGKGYEIEHGAPAFAGFPATLGIAIPGLSVAAPPAEGGWRWQSGGVRVTLHAGAPTEPVIDLTGSHRLTGLLSAPDKGLSLNVGRGLASLAFARNGAIDNVVLKLSETTIADANGDVPMLSFMDSSLHVATDSGHITLWMRDITLPDEVPVLSETITALDLTLDVVGPRPSGPLREALNAWREGGGAIEVREAALDWPPARAAGSGTIALDAALQPIGAATFKFQGFFEIVSALVESGHVDPGVESLAKIVLGMLAKPSATGTAELSLPLTVQDRTLHAGPVKLMEMPEVVWDADARVP